MNLPITQLVEYAIKAELIAPCDRVYASNALLETLALTEYTPEPVGELPPLEEILSTLLDYAVEKGLIEDGVVSRDLFDTKLMGKLTPFPSQVEKEFSERYAISPEKATQWYYEFSQNTDYIRSYRIAKDVKWLTDTAYGKLDITINLSKPEKDPKSIAAAKLAPQGGYPKCLLCQENQGYAGHLNHPARQNHRLIPVEIDQQEWFLQYSPYVYYNEHCICFSSQHIPMKIEKATFQKLLDFVRQFPHYFVGSNADLPIVGGSILSHDHFQGGRHNFAMAVAPIEREISGFDNVKVGIVKWPMSVLRLSSPDINLLVQLADRILTAWRGYSDPSAHILAESQGEPHNTITPIARFRDGAYELDLVLRNNRCTEEHPMGLFHPHAQLHHIKKENIGLIEVMGLAVLPARLKTELAQVATVLLEGGEATGDLEKHAPWVEAMRARHSFTPENVEGILQQEVGEIFAMVLEHAGVYPCTKEGREGFLRFIESI
ncbi:MAG: UDP-glucose--hexose-1-phosphate uridylyltransferase [Eubacteriales bacterium]